MIYVSAQYCKKNALQYDAYHLVQSASRMMECLTWEVDGWGGSGGRGYPWPLSHIDTSKLPACTGRHSPPCMNMITDMFQTNSNPFASNLVDGDKYFCSKGKVKTTYKDIILCVPA